MSNSFKSVISSDSFYYKILLTGFVIVFLYLFNQFSQNGRYIDNGGGGITDSRTGDRYESEAYPKPIHYEFSIPGPGSKIHLP